MTYNIHSKWPAMFCVSDIGGSQSTVVQGNTRPFMLPSDITTADKLRVRFFAFTNGSVTQAVVKIGKNEDPSGGELSGVSGFTDFSTPVTSTTANVGITSLANAVAFDQSITCTSDMVTHAGNGDGFALAINSASASWVYGYGISIYLEYA